YNQTMDRWAIRAPGSCADPHPCEVSQSRCPLPGMSQSSLRFATDLDTHACHVVDDVDFLPEVLADFTRPEPAGLPVEGQAPDVADAISPNLGTGVGTADEGIVFGDRVVLAAFAMVNVDAEDLAEQGPEILTVLVGVVTG